MTVNMIIRLKRPADQVINCICERFPLLSSVILQLAAAVFMVGVVSAIGVIGGTMIWLFYRAFGVM